MSANGRFAKTHRQSEALMGYEDLACSKHPADVLSKEGASISFRNAKPEPPGKHGTPVGKYGIISSINLKFTQIIL